MADGAAERETAYKVAEYQAATEAYLHYDSFRWQSGSLLIAGAFVFLGFLVQVRNPSLVDFGALAVTFVMSAWLLYAQHHRNLYLFKLDRIWELEREMGLEQNLRFREKEPGVVHYRRVGIPGHFLDRLVAAGISLTGICLALLNNDEGIFTIIAFVMIAGTVFWVVLQERRVHAELPSDGTTR